MTRPEQEPLGPRAIRPAGDYELSPARERVLGLLAQAVEPVTISEIADRVGGHVNSARAHLDGLVAEALVERAVRQSGTRGRPRYEYAITTEGRAVQHSLEHAESRALEYHELLRAFAGHLESYRERPGAAARDIGRLWGQSLARPSGSEPRQQVLDLLAQLGFTPVERPGDGLIELRTCPLVSLASEHPEVICNVHVGLVQSVLRSAGADPEDVVLTPFAAPGACHLTLPQS